MFFWVGLAVVLVVFVCLVTWGVRGIEDRAHEPGTQYLNRPRARRARNRGTGRGPEAPR
jgi:hypothetical protein